ncbi:MAG: hypothetical protein R3Y32_07005 [Bacillota bacterium]
MNTNIDNRRKKLINSSHGDGEWWKMVYRGYEFIEHECEKNEDLCSSLKVNSIKFSRYIYQDVRNGEVDHAHRHIANNVVNELKECGYIKFLKKNDVWMLKIADKLDIFDDSIIKSKFKHVKMEEKAILTSKEKARKVHQHLLKNGINIYEWERKCFKCGKKTKVKTYLLANQILNELGEEFVPCAKEYRDFNLFETLGLGYFDSLDNYLMELYPTIKKKYSKEMGKEYVMNTCNICGMHFGINYTVYQPKEILNMPKKDLENLIVDRVDIKDLISEFDILIYMKD